MDHSAVLRSQSGGSRVTYCIPFQLPQYQVSTRTKPLVTYAAVHFALSFSSCQLAVFTEEFTEHIFTLVANKILHSPIGPTAEKIFFLYFYIVGKSQKMKDIS